MIVYIDSYMARVVARRALNDHLFCIRSIAKNALRRGRAFRFFPHISTVTG